MVASVVPMTTLSNFEKVVALLSTFFKNDEQKVIQWLQAKNPNFGGYAPMYLFEKARGHKVLKFVEAASDLNGWRSTDDRELENLLNKTMMEVLKQHHEHLEKFICAFIAEVGSEKASEYVLVEQKFDDRVEWRFEHKNDLQHLIQSDKEDLN